MCQRVATIARGTTAFITTVTLVPVFCFNANLSAGDIPAVQPKMGDPLPGLTPEQLLRFDIGRMKYDHTLMESEGLGPVFNKQSCSNCHNKPMGGTGNQTVTRFGLSEKGGFNPLEEFGGSLLQALSISENCLETVHSSANVIALRVTNGMMGYGLVEAIPDADILAVRDAQPTSQRGFANMVTAFEDPPPKNPKDPPILHVGRFGWKAQVATVLTFSADAALNEMGLTNRFLQEENDPNGILPPSIEECDAVPDPEDGPDVDGFHFIDRVTDFQRFLAGPPQTPKSGMTGETIFNAIGCAVCHHPTFTTSNDPSIEEALRGKVIRPYSDFLLHDMGLNADFIQQGNAGMQMLKTPPLWGLRVRDPMWHDGRFGAGTFESRVTDAIMAHDDGFGFSQGRFAAQAFASLDPQQKAQLIAFLDSLGRREFDHTGDDIVAVDDFLVMVGCVDFEGTITPDDLCAISDVDQDGDVDLDDFNAFMTVYTGPMSDCNGNGIVDLQDIFTGVAADTNANGIPDSCEPTCTGDTNGSGTVDVSDLLAVINQWGSCPPSPAPCAGDVNVTGDVDVNDLLQIITSWGPCP